MVVKLCGRPVSDIVLVYLGGSGSVDKVQICPVDSVLAKPVFGTCELRKDWRRFDDKEQRYKCSYGMERIRSSRKLRVHYSKYIDAVVLRLMHTVCSYI